MAVDRGGDGHGTLSSALFDGDRSGFASLVALPSNVRAIESALLFSGGIQTFVVLAGPSGWAKTQMLRAVAHTVHREQGHRAPIVSASGWDSHVSRIDGLGPLLLDDVQYLFGRLRAGQQLRQLLEKRVRLGRPVILACTLEGSLRPMRQFLPREREWVVAAIGEPEAAERELIVRHLAQRERVDLPRPLVALLAKRAAGNGHSLSGAIQRLRAADLTLSDHLGCLRAAGLMHPYLGDQVGWDLRDHTHEVIQGIVPSLREAGWTVCAREASMLAMRSLLGLGEDEVGSFFGIDRGRVFSIVNRLEREGDHARLERCRDRMAGALVGSFDSL